MKKFSEFIINEAKKKQKYKKTFTAKVATGLVSLIKGLGRMSRSHGFQRRLPTKKIPK